MRRLLISAVAAAAGILIAALLLFHPQVRRIYPPATSVDVPKANSIPLAGPLTAGSADAELVRNSSVKAALDGMAFSARSTQLSAGQVSVLELLGEENHER